MDAANFIMQPPDFIRRLRRAALIMTRPLIIAASVLASASLLFGQGGAKPDAGRAGTPAGYVLGPGDQVALFVEDLPDEFANKTFRIDTSGVLSIPMIGHIHAAGLTTEGLEREAEGRLTHILKNPEVAVSLSAFGSEPVSILGAVNNPGIRQLEGHKTLFEALSAAGGLRSDAGYQVNITRNLKWGRIPLPQAKVDSTGESSIATVKLSDLINATNPAENIAIFPGDAISVPRAQLVYAVGSVVRAGGFPLNERSSISALQVVSLAEGLQKTAASTRAMILRAEPGSSNRIRIPVDLKKLLAGKLADVQLEPDDILFVPNSNMKVVRQETINTIVGTTSAMLIWGRF